MFVKVTLSFCILFLFFITNSYGSNYTNNKSSFPYREDSTDVLIRIDPMDEAKLDLLKEAIKRNSNWSYYGYCKQHGVAFINVPQLPESTKEQLKSIAKQIGFASLEVKQFGFGDLTQYCSFPSSTMEVLTKKVQQ